MSGRLAGSIGRLSPRQRQVLVLWALGRSYDAIATDLGIGAKTVEAHLTTARYRLGVAHGMGSGRRLCYELGQFQASEVRP